MWNLNEISLFFKTTTLLNQLGLSNKHTGQISAEGYGPPTNECPWYDIKQSNPVQELLAMQNTSSLLSLPIPLWPGVVAPDRVLFIGQIELSDI